MEQFAREPAQNRLTWAHYKEIDRFYIIGQTGSHTATLETCICYYYSDIVEISTLYTYCVFTNGFTVLKDM